MEKASKINIGERIASLRKKMGLTQSELAEKLFVSYQAVSQWENQLTYPDIQILPEIARIFKVKIDSLFSEETLEMDDFDYKDDTLYIVLYKGKNVMKALDYEFVKELKENITINITGQPLNVQSNFSVEIDGDVNGNVSAGNDINCENVKGNANAGNNIVCEDINNNASAVYSINCDDIAGSVNANTINCETIFGSVTCTGEINCETINGATNTIKD